MAANRMDVRAAAGDPGWDWSKIHFEAKPKESAAELKHRLQMERWNMIVDIGRRVALYVATAIGASVVGWYCLTIIQNPAASPDDRKWATALLASIITALIGFVVGQRGPGSSK